MECALPLDPRKPLAAIINEGTRLGTRRQKDLHTMMPTLPYSKKAPKKVLSSFV